MPKLDGKTLIECETCHQTFSKRDHLLRHLRSHTGEKPYSCPICFKSYGRSDVLRRHMVSHGGPKGPDDQANQTTMALLNGSTNIFDPASPLTANSLQGSPANANSVTLPNAIPNVNPVNGLASSSATGASLLQNLAQSPTNQFLYQNNAGAPNTYTTDPTQFSNYTDLPPLISPAETSGTATPAKGSFDQSWDPMMADFFDFGDNLNTGNNVLQRIQGLPADFWDSSLLDFSTFLPNDTTMDIPIDCTRPPVLAPMSHLTPAEKVSAIWPTRPSRRAAQLKPNDPVVVDPQFRARHSLEIDNATAQRMYQHLQGGGIPFRLPLPPIDTLSACLQLYFENWHPIWPMFHVPTFQANKTSGLLLLNMVAIGALFLNTPEADDLSSALMQKMHEALSFCMSNQIENYSEPYDRDILAICQAYMLRQLYWLTAGDSNQLESTQLFHATVANVARRAGVFSDQTYSPSGELLAPPADDLEAQWRFWVNQEVRRRTALCFIINDLTFATLFLTPPVVTVASVSWSLTPNDALFSASTAAEWKALQAATNPKPGTNACLYDVAASLFSGPPQNVFARYRESPLSTHILISSILSVVLSTRVSRPDLDDELYKDSKAVIPLVAVLLSAYNAIQSLTVVDCFCAEVTWNSAWIHLLADIKLIEIACGREGTEQAEAAHKRASRWANSQFGRRACLHASSISNIVKTLQFSCEVPPHVYISLFQSWLVLRTFVRYHKPQYASMPRTVNWPSLRGVGIINNNSKIPDNANVDWPAVYWIRDGVNIPDGQLVISAMNDIRQTLARVGNTKIKNMLGQVIEAIESADKGEAQ